MKQQNQPLSPQTLLASDKCFCPKSKKVTIENEIVCSTCGVVFGTDNTQETLTASHLNLYLRTENGGHPSDRPKDIRKLHIHSSDSSQISDICTKLSLTDSLSTEIWNLYNILRKKASFSKAKSACFAIYHVCRKNNIPFLEDEIRDIVCLSFNVQKAPKVLDIYSKINKKFVNPKPSSTTTIGINTNDANPDGFYLKRHLKISQQNHPDISYD